MQNTSEESQNKTPVILVDQSGFQDNCHSQMQAENTRFSSSWLIAAYPAITPELTNRGRREICKSQDNL
jgi:hypothetical protein